MFKEREQFVILSPGDQTAVRSDCVFPYQGISKRYRGYMSLSRLDKLLVDVGLAASRTQAQRLIKAGAVRANIQGVWILCDKPSAKLPHTVALHAEEIDELRYVSRAGLKLERALHHLCDKSLLPDPLHRVFNSKVLLDVGQSTGGFTDCALRFGASRVIGVDVGHDQLVERLRQDPRVVCCEGVNARHLSSDVLMQNNGEYVDTVVMDVSFISQTLILPSAIALLKPGGNLLSLVKPQFEIGKDGLGSGGLVKDPQAYPAVQQRITAVVQELDMEVLDYFPSAIDGSDGNKEFFIYAVKRNGN